MRNIILISILSLFASYSLLALDSLTEKRSIDDFKGLNINSVIEVEIYKGKKDFIEIETENMLSSDIISTVSNGILKLELTDKNHQNIKALVKIYIDDLESIKGTSASSFKTMDGLNLDQLTVDLNSARKGTLNVRVGKLKVSVNSASNLEITGKCDMLEAHVNSAAKLNAYGLETKNAKLKVSSVAIAKVNVSNDLNIQASSMSKVYYKGIPTNLQKEKSSMSEIKSIPGNLKKIK